MRVRRSCQDRRSSSSVAQRRPRPSGQTETRTARMRRRMARRVGFSSSKVQRAMRAQRIPGVDSEKEKKSAWYKR